MSRRKIPVPRSNKFKKSPAPKKPPITDEIVKERAKNEGFRYMWFKNIPTTVEDFKEKENVGWVRESIEGTGIRQ